MFDFVNEGFDPFFAAEEVVNFMEVTFGSFREKSSAINFPPLISPKARLTPLGEAPMPLGIPEHGTWFCVSAFLAFGIFIDHAVRLYLSKIKIGARRF